MKRLFALILIVFMLCLTSCSTIDGIISKINPEDPPTEKVMTDVKEPEATPPEVNNPENNQPEVNEPETNEPEGNQPEVNEPEANEPENNQPEANEPENNQPEVNEPETNEPEGNQPEANEPETNEPAHTHTYTATITPPTCTAKGYITYTCSGCNDVLEDKTEIPSVGHSYTATVIAPTCESKGYTVHTCSICSESYNDSEVDALGHTEKTVAGKAATCTSTGLTEGIICSTCTTVIAEQHEIPAKGHTDVSPTDFVCDDCGADLCTEHVEEQIKGTAPTCTKNGLTDGVKCSACGEILTAQTEIAATGHSYTSVVTAPTCDTDGYTTYTCTVCTHSYTADVTAKTGHSYTSVVTAPTCTAKGYITYTCTTCSTTLSEKTEIAPTGHSYNSTVTAPTCTNEGYTTHVCATCGDTYTDGNTAALGHTETAVTGKAATCTSVGYTDGVICSVCKVIITAQTEIAATGHSYESEVTAPTCTAGGYTTHTCTVCGNSYTDGNTNPINHTYSEKITYATCTEGGYTTFTCTVCSYTYTGNEVYATGHSWLAATTEAPKTCETCGATEGDKLPSGTGSDTGSDSGTTSTPSVSYSTLSVNYINVGQGDSILIKVDDCDILIDGGKSTQGSTVTSYLKSKGVDDIELMINTHPDEDHYGGLTTVLNSYVVEQAWGSSFSKSTSTYTSFKSAVSNEGLSLKTPSVGTVYTYQQLSITVLYSGSGASSSNDSSLVVMLEYGSFRFLFTGDISTTVENKLVGSSDLSCDVLKVPHHGSSGSSGSSFLTATGADYGVICVGSNSYGHPTSEALSRLSSAGISVYRTDQDGNVVFSTNGSTLTLPGGTSVSGGSGSGSSGSTSGGTTSGGTTSGGTTSGGSTSTNNDTFIGNTESKVFHLPTCSHLPAASKRNTMYNYYWIINIAGYRPCGICLKNYVP